MSVSTPDISIVVVSYNVRDLLENCLYSLYSALEGISHEIFVVDNDSTDATVDMVRQRFPDVEMIASQENLGFARGNNLALARARGKYLLLLNPDTLVQEDSITAMLDFFRENADVGMATCKIIKPDGSLEPGCRRSFPSPWVSFTKLAGLSSLFPHSSLFARYNLTYLSEDETYEVDAISGSFMMLRREVYEEIGGLDESYFMYGEDLDWCYRTQKAGWKLYYVHSTKIIHYGGESTKRSSIDATAEFYRAMQVFAKNNLGLSPVWRILIEAGIKLRLLFSRSHYAVERTMPLLADAVTTILAMMAAELLRFGGLFRFPDYAYPTVYIAVVAIMWTGMFIAGSYTREQHRIVRSGLGVLLAFLILSSLTYFFKDWQFSRMVVLIAGGLNLALIPGRRILAGIFSPGMREQPVTGRRTLLVGRNEESLEVLNKLKSLDNQSYDIVGLIDLHRREIGNRYFGVEVIGSVENIGKVIDENNVTDVIIGPGVLSYTAILSMISRTRGKAVHYRIVPRTKEFIIGKARVDQLTSVPLLDFEYNLMKSSNRFFKRLMDIALSFPGILLIYPFTALLTDKQNPGAAARFVLGLPSVLRGTKSLVGYDPDHADTLPEVYLGKPGLTGLAQLRGKTLSEDEILSSVIQYVRDYSVFLDMEILIRTLMLSFMRRNKTR
ncbi:glycosyltransferase [bacterium]|nr:glycosyltransferase [bacterium]